MKKDYEKVCGKCKHKPFSHCENPKGRNYIPEGKRKNTDNIDEFDTCYHFEQRR